MGVVRSPSTILNWIITSSLVSGFTPNKDFSVSSVYIYGFFIILRKSRLVCIEIIDSTNVVVHIHRENVTCRTRVYLLANRNPFLNWKQYSQACKSDHSFRVEYTNFVKNSIIVNPHHLLPLSVQIVLWMIFDCLWSEYFSCIPFWNCLHFFDRSLSLESDFWSFTFCRLLPRWGRVSCLKSH